MDVSTDLAKKLTGIGISESYASQLANSPPRRKPSLGLALKIYHKLGVKMGPLVGAMADEIPALERLAERRAK